MSDEGELRRMAREAVLSRRIPGRRPDRMWGGPGNGAPCAVCAAVLTREDIVLEVEFWLAEPGSLASTHHFHARCFAAWEAEWRDLRPPAADVTMPDRERDRIPAERPQ